MFALLLLPAAGESLAQDDPPDTFEFSLSCGDPSGPCNFVAEDDGGSPAVGVTTTITVTAAYPAGTSTPATATALTFTVTGIGGTAGIATAGTDFMTVDPLVLTILPNERMVTGTFDFEAVEDDEDEGLEIVTVTPTTSAAIITTVPAATTFSINDNEPVPGNVVSRLDITSVTEGDGDGTSTISVTAGFPVGSRVIGSAVDVAFTVSAGTATEDTTTTENDYEVSATTFTVTIAAGDLEGTDSFVLTVNDDTVLDRPDGLPETIILTPEALGYSELPATLTIEIVDDDTQADTITLSLDPASVTEDSGTPTITVTASLAENTATATNVLVTPVLVASTGDGFATATDDFTVGTISVITITAGMLTGTETFMLTVVDDSLPEGDETLVFSAAPIDGYTIVNATLTIGDDNTQADTIRLSLEPASVTEGTGTTTNTSDDDVVTTITEITVTASIPDGTATGTALPVTVALVTGTGAGTATISMAADAAAGTAAVLGNFELAADAIPVLTVLTIAAGSRTATGTFMLTVVDDEETEGDKTLVFSGSLDDAVPGFNAIDPVTLTIVDNDGAPSIEAALPELARASVTSVIDVLSGRIAQVASGSLGDGSVSFAGHSSLAQALAANQQGLNDGDLSLLEALGGSSIALELDGTGTAAPSAGGQAGSSGVGVWASANYDRISSTAPGVGDWDGNSFSLFVGVDGHVSRNTLIGVAASWSKGSTEFDDDPTLEIDTSLLGLNPYIGWHSDDGKKTAWGTVGYSTGDFEQDQKNIKTDLKMTVLAIGGSTRFAERAGFDYNIKGDLSTAELTTDATDSLAEVKSKAHRARVAVEAGVDKASDSGGHVMRSVALGLRYDGGDGDTGSGLELDGELGWSGPNRGVSVSGAANVLLFHTGDLKEWGLGGLIRYEPSHAKGRNLTFRAQPSYGPGESGSGQLWDQQVKDLDEDGGEPEARLVMDAGWGLAALSGRALVTPYSGLELSEGGSRVYRLGSRVAVDSIFNIDLAANRTEDGDSPEHGIGLQLGMQW